MTHLPHYAERQRGSPSRCVSCRQWHTHFGQWWWDRHDRCIRNLPGVDFACCGHGGGRSGKRWAGKEGYISARCGVIRFPGDVHPLLVRAAVSRYLRTGAVPGFARADALWAGPRRELSAGCRFRTALDKRYRRWRKRRRSKA